MRESTRAWNVDKHRIFHDFRSSLIESRFNEHIELKLIVLSGLRLSISFVPEMKEWKMI